MQTKWTPKKDPKATFNCANDECNKPVNEIVLKNEDPFCSSMCCRVWHGTDADMMTTISTKG